ncbi:MAG TPA: KH domain-containing protein [bacterium]|nr:KH domain-containing protein [bacterium]HPP88902.1 KH domain-containing protein [bacterium]
MEEFIVTIVKKLVDNPQDVQVREVQGEKTIIYELKVNQADLGKVIGKHGRIISAIRTILKAATAKSENRVMLEVLD